MSKRNRHVSIIGTMNVLVRMTLN